MEWGTLSKHTGNDTYRQLAEKSSRHIATLVSSAHCYLWSWIPSWQSCLGCPIARSVSSCRYELHFYLVSTVRSPRPRYRPYNWPICWWICREHTDLVPSACHVLMAPSSDFIRRGVEARTATLNIWSNTHAWRTQMTLSGPIHGGLLSIPPSIIYSRLSSCYCVLFPVFLWFW